MGLQSLTGGRGDSLSYPTKIRKERAEQLSSSLDAVRTRPKSVLAGISLNKPAFAGTWEYRREEYRQRLPPAGRIISGGHAARDAAHCSPRSRQISAAALTKGRRATGGLRSGCHEIPSRRGGGSGRMGTTATFGSFSSTVRSGSTA